MWTSLPIRGEALGEVMSPVGMRGGDVTGRGDKLVSACNVGEPCGLGNQLEDTAPATSCEVSKVWSGRVTVRWEGATERHSHTGEGLPRQGPERL